LATPTGRAPLRVRRFPRFDAAAVRFLGRAITERRGNTLGSVTLAPAALGELRGRRHEAALKTLLGLL
jgi:hypothetical protein